MVEDWIAVFGQRTLNTMSLKPPSCSSIWIPQVWGPPWSYRDSPPKLNSEKDQVEEISEDEMSDENEEDVDPGNFHH